jgi:hypothetical protein
VAFGPCNTIFAAAGLLFLAGGLTSIAPMRATAAIQAGGTAPDSAPAGVTGPAV